ncbi:MAG: GTPase [archaeon]
MENVLIMGAAGRDFHNFLTYYKNRKDCMVVGFTATQIPGIEKRSFPKSLAGENYIKDIPIFDEKELSKLIKELKVNTVVFSYSDVLHNELMQKASIVLASGANFKLLGLDTMVESSKPVIAVCAIRTGCGKSQTTRYIAEKLKELGKTVSVVRHPMPYGDLEKQAVQEFNKMEDLEKQDCTIEEREEYEPLIKAGFTVFAGVDYEKILRQAEEKSDIIIWDGGNNDFSFYKANLYITVVDPLRVGHELSYFPGMVNFLLADVILINKENVAEEKEIQKLKENIAKHNPKAVVVDADSVLTAVGIEKVSGKKVLVIEDGPTLTHGSMLFGAGFKAAEKAGAIIINPLESAVGSIKETFEKFPLVNKVLPAMGYSKQQINDLQETINSSDAEFVVSGTPIDLNKVVKSEKEIITVSYELKEREEKLAGILKEKLRI